MTQNFSLYKTVFVQLLKTELIQLRKIFTEQIIDTSIWLSCTVIVLGYIMGSQFGTTPNFPSFVLAGCIASVGFLEIYPNSFTMVSDFENTQIISHYAILPIPSWLLFINKMMYWIIVSGIKTIFAIGLGKLILLNDFVLSDINMIKTATMLFMANIFFSALTIFFVGIVPNITKMRKVWVRYLFPLWFVGGFQSPWQSMYALAPKLATLNLLNPIVYTMEGSRAAILGQTGYLPFWTCVGILVLCSTLCGTIAIIRLKKRLDLV